MPDHAHILLAPQRVLLPDIVHQWKFKTGYSIGQSRRQKGGIWQPRYFDFICRRVRDVWEKLDYIHQNPLAAGLVTRAEDWPWSRVCYYLGKGKPLLAPDHVELPLDTNALLWPAPWRQL